MRWGDLRRSGNVEDRRGMGGAAGVGGLGIGGLLLVGLLSWATGLDPRLILSGVEMVGGGGQTQQQAGREGAPSDEVGGFVSAVLGSTEDVWNGIFQESGQTYRQPRLVIYERGTNSACGFGQAAMGPFYCPPDQRVYLDTSFFRDLAQRFKAPGEFAAAYVIAHEIGHHVQNVIGVLPRVHEERRRVSERQSNDLSVRTELQADCFAGIWAYHANQRGIVEPGDVEQALAAATAIGDDRLQQQSSGTVVPDSFTHGSSEQRVRWFRAGLQSGNMRDCNTFEARSL
jgi:uncharacterized protein